MSLVAFFSPPWPRSSVFGLLLQLVHESIPVPRDRNLDAPANPPIVSHPLVLQVLQVDGYQTHTSAAIQSCEGGLVRLTRFVEMPLDACCAGKMPLRGVFGSVVNRHGEQTQVEVWCSLPCGQPHSDFPRRSQGCSQVLDAHLRNLDCRVNFAVVVGSSRSGSGSCGSSSRACTPGWPADMASELLSVHRARHSHRSLGMSLVIASDANVWDPHFRLCTRSCDDAMILQFVDQQANHISEGGLDCVSPEVVQSPSLFTQAIIVVRRRQPACWPLLGSDHILCVAHSIPLSVQKGPDALCPLASGEGPPQALLISLSMQVS